MASVNLVFLAGRLTRDPEMRITSSGTAVCNFNVATNSYAMRDGERKELVEYHNCVAWNQGNRKLAEWVANGASKGTFVFLEGRLQTRSWEGQDGQKRRTVEVVVSEVQVLKATADGQPVAAAMALDDGLERAPDA